MVQHLLSNVTPMKKKILKESGLPNSLKIGNVAKINKIIIDKLKENWKILSTRSGKCARHQHRVYNSLVKNALHQQSFNKVQSLTG